MLGEATSVLRGIFFSLLVQPVFLAFSLLPLGSQQLWSSVSLLLAHVVLGPGGRPEAQGLRLSLKAYFSGL